MRTYSALCQLNTFEDRFNFLKLGGSVGRETFGFERYLNQRFYQSTEWLSVRDYVITRDLGCDLGCDGFEIVGRIVVHHMNPISVSDIVDVTDFLLDPEFLISCRESTHRAIHFGDLDQLLRGPVVRKPNDTCPWKG